MSYGHIPAPPLPPPPSPEVAARKSWLSRNVKWFVPTFILGLILVITVAVGGMVALVLGLMKSSEPYRHAVEVATNNRQVTSELGEPVVPGWYVTGNFNTSGSGGQADMAIPLRGRLHDGTVRVIAKKTGDDWTYETLEVQVEGHESPIQLLPAASPREDN